MTDTPKTKAPATTTQKTKKVALNPAFNEILKSQLVCTVWPHLDIHDSKEKYESARKYIAESKLKNAGQHLLPEKCYRVYKLNLPEIDAAEIALDSIGAKDPIEGMLATEMVSLHFNAMECLHMAATSYDSFGERNEYLKTAAKLSKTFAALVNAFSCKKNKGKIKQEITVQYIHLEGESQAVIGGKITSKGRGVRKKLKQPYGQEDER